MRLDRFVAVALGVLALVEIFVGHAVPGPRPVATAIALGLAAFSVYCFARARHPVG